MVGCCRINDQGHFNSSGAEGPRGWRGGGTLGMAPNPGVPFLGSPSSAGNQFTTPKELSECITLRGMAMEKHEVKSERVYKSSSSCLFF